MVPEKTWGGEVPETGRKPRKPSIYLPIIQYNYGKSSFLMGRLTINNLTMVETTIPLGRFHHDLTSRPKPIDDGECKVNYPQMVPICRLVNFTNLPRIHP